MRRSADHAMLLAYRAKTIEREYARTKSVRDLTEVIRVQKEVKEAVRNSAPPKEVRKGIPIGQRWE